MSRAEEAAKRLQHLGYVVAPPPACACTHGKAVHRFGNSETATTGERTKCSVVTGNGPCGCLKYTPVEAGDGG